MPARGVRRGHLGNARRQAPVGHPPV